MDDPELFTIYEIYLKSGCRFPFWVTNDRPKHFKFLVLTYGWWVNKEWIDFELNRFDYELATRPVFAGQIYEIETGSLVKRWAYIRAHKVRTWLPYKVNKY